MHTPMWRPCACAPQGSWGTARASSRRGSGTISPSRSPRCTSVVRAKSNCDGWPSPGGAPTTRIGREATAEDWAEGGDRVRVGRGNPGEHDVCARARGFVYAVARMGDDGAKMYEFFERTGYTVDLPALRAQFPTVKWHSFEDWAREQPWTEILGQTTA